MDLVNLPPRLSAPAVLLPYRQPAELGATAAHALVVSTDAVSAERLAGIVAASGVAAAQTPPMLAGPSAQEAISAYETMLGLKADLCTDSDYDREMRRWSGAYGSARLKAALAGRYDARDLYTAERLRHEFGTRETCLDPRHATCTRAVNPSLAGLRLVTAVVNDLGFWGGDVNADVAARLVNLTEQPSWPPRFGSPIVEAVEVVGWLRRHTVLVVVPERDRTQVAEEAADEALLSQEF